MFSTINTIIVFLGNNFSFTTSQNSSKKKKTEMYFNVTKNLGNQNVELQWFEIFVISCERDDHRYESFSRVLQLVLCIFLTFFVTNFVCSSIICFISIYFLMSLPYLTGLGLADGRS